ncbi:chitinase [Streptomyces incarnatus]|uniref:Chitinase n=1 Tax=Streptomyces incarnatus TaxID=665007 RepID=A0ABM5TDU8_9ACTN|nr:chitinase [Streptomyces incarnatus]AKJ09128.1 chitinase [Streptomyces incarnatus]
MRKPRAVYAVLTAVLIAVTGVDLTATTASAAEHRGGFVVSKAQYNKMFPKHKKVYSYQGLVKAMKAFPAFAHTGDAKTRKREAAAFLANVSHETSGLIYINEQNKAAWPTYCAVEPYGCPAGQSAYHGRGPLQISWNYNYKAAGDAFHVDLLHHPNLAAKNPTVTWELALWYWMTQSGPGTMSSHHAMVKNRGFGETIRSINGGVECNGGNPAEVHDRIAKYKKFTKMLHVSTGGNLGC